MGDQGGLQVSNSGGLQVGDPGGTNDGMKVAL